MKYQILNYLKENEATAIEIANHFNYEIESVKVILSRLKNKDELIEVVGNINKEYIYRAKDEIWLAFKELFGFFTDIMRNQKELNIGNKKLWNKLWNKRKKHEPIIKKISEKINDK